MIFFLFLIRHKIASRFMSFFWYVFLCIISIQFITSKKCCCLCFLLFLHFTRWKIERELSITHVSCRALLTKYLNLLNEMERGKKLIASHEKNIVWHLSVCAFNLYCETETPAKMLKLPPTRYSTHGSAGEQLVLLMICWRFTIIV